MFTVRKQSCGKVMFSQACVNNSMHRRRRCTQGEVGRHVTGQTPPAGRHPRQADRHPTGQTPPWQADIPPTENLCRHPPTPEMANAVDVMHPTGMHSCFRGVLLSTGGRRVREGRGEGGDTQPPRHGTWDTHPLPPTGHLPPWY